jgi:Family of unknown function (DUF5995)
MLTATIDELRSVALAADDASGYFPAMYARITREVETAATAGHVANPQRMEVFARAFAEWYPRMRHDPARAPGCWQAAFDAAGDGRLMIVQHLLLGINAHVNHDLPQVVVALTPRGADLGDVRADFDAVNDILAESLPMVLRSLGTVSRWVNTAAVLGGGRLFDFSLQVARRRAWEAAVRMHALADADRAEYAIELDRLVRVLAYMVVHPGPVSSLGVALGRRCEERDPRSVTRKLLGPLA